MYAIASAIAGSLRTSTAPTGSRPLQLLWILLLRLVAQLSRGRRSGGAWSSCGPTQRLPRFISFSYGSLGRSDGRYLSGWSSCGSTRWSTRSQLQGRQSSRGPTRWRPGMQLALFKSLQFVRSSDGLNFPWVTCPAADLRGGPPGNGSS
jgi:hypothetical protein